MRPCQGGPARRRPRAGTTIRSIRPRSGKTRRCPPTGKSLAGSAAPSTRDPLRAIDRCSRLDDRTVADIFATGGVRTSDGSVTASWSRIEKAQVEADLDAISAVADVRFAPTTDPGKPQFRLFSIMNLEEKTGAVSDMAPPGEPCAGQLGVMPTP